jgi:hypothetical protein
MSNNYLSGKKNFPNEKNEHEKVKIPQGIEFLYFYVFSNGYISEICM